MKYATEKTFDGRRLSIGQTVIVRSVSQPCATPATVLMVGDADEVTLREACSMHPIMGLKFVKTKTEDDINALSEGAWTWPVRV